MSNRTPEILSTWSELEEIFITKKNHHDTLSQNAKNVFETLLWVQWIRSVKIYNRYQVFGVSKDEFTKCIPTVFSESPLDDTYTTENFNSKNNWKWIIPIESNPWQYDARVDALQKNISLITWRERNMAHYTQVVVIDGDIIQADKEKIEKWLINAVEKRKIVLDEERRLQQSIKRNEAPKIVEWFIWTPRENIKNFLDSHHLFPKWKKCSLDQEDLEFIYDYFKNEEQREPTETEIRLIETYWSDHCRHTTFLTEIENIDIQWDEDIVRHLNTIKSKIEEKHKEAWKKPNSLMALATSSARILKEKKKFKNRKNLVESEEENAATYTTEIELADGTTEIWEILFKNETHNSPTETEPFGGAATCIGGAIRDTLSGRAYTFQAMRISGSKNPLEPIDETLAWKVSQRAISLLAASWFSAYGNQIGLAAGEVVEYFHPWFLAKRFECGYVVAATPQKNVVKKSPQKWDVVIMFWGRTGRDGIGGATVASSWQSAWQHGELGAHVQKWNPVEERKIQRLILNGKFTKYIKKCNDFGAGWVSVAIGELARWLDINLDVIPLKYEGLNDTEIAISESQERMAIVIAPEDVEKVLEMIEAENLEAVQIATVTNDDNKGNDRLIMKYQWHEAVNISRKFLDTNGAPRKTKAKVNLKNPNYFSEIDKKVKESLEQWNIHGSILTLLEDKRNALQKWMKSLFDESVGASTILASHGGRHQLSPQVWMVSKIPTFEGVDSKTGIISTHGYNPDLMSQNTYIGWMFAIIESISKVVALWGDYEKTLISLQEYFWELTSDEKWGEVYGAIMGTLEVLLKLKIAAIGGKDSMSGSFKTKEGRIIDVPPTIVSFTNTVVDTDNVVSAELKNTNSTLLYFPIEIESAGIPNLESYKQTLDTVKWLIAEGKVRSSSVVGNGGLITTLSKMMLGNRVGVTLNTYDEIYFQPRLWGIVLEVWRHTAKKYTKNIIGFTKEETNLKIGDIESLEISKIQDALVWTFEWLFPTENPKEKIEKIQTYTQRKALDILNPVNKPKALIPVFPGTNSELDTQHALIKAWFDVEFVVFPTEDTEGFTEERKRFAQLLSKTNLLVFPGWFSGGDEPDGSAKFIVNTMKSPEIKDALNQYLKRQDSLTLGICNGFQALIKLGVFDEGAVKDQLTEQDETLAHNTSLKHETGLVRTKVISILSPFLWKSSLGDEYIIPISHGEGRVVFEDQTRLQRYINNWQVPLQYCDEFWNPSNQVNGSEKWIAALTSKDGRICGMMPHPERRGRNVFRNVSVGNKMLPVFQSAFTSITWKDAPNIQDFEGEHASLTYENEKVLANDDEKGRIQDKF